MTKRTRWLLQTLILSVVLNITFVGIFFYFFIRENTLPFAFEPKHQEDVERMAFSPALLERLHTLSFHDLVQLLEDKRVVEAGLRVCDFALGALVSFHDFDLVRALSRRDLPSRISTFNETPFTLFPDLSEDDYVSLRAFIETEQWPWTTRGFFKHIEREGIENCDPLLLSQFCHRPEFIVFETLFARTKLPIQKGTLLNVVIDGGWESFAHFYAGQQKQSDFSDAARRALLLDLVNEGIESAAHLFLTTDFEYAAHHLTDHQIDQLLSLFSEKTPQVLEFVQQVAASPRSESVNEKATAYIGVPEKKLRPLFRDRPPAAPEPSVHIVQPGESLWLIARKYNISIESLKQINHLRTNTLHPNQTLKIPRA